MNGNNNTIIKKSFALFLKILPIEFLIFSLSHINQLLCKLLFIRDWTLLSYGRPQFYKHYSSLISWLNDPSLWSFTARGVYARENMFPDCKVLDLCCGDGSNSYLFFSSIASHIDAVDNNTQALPNARRYSSAKNINFLKIDIINSPLPNVKYDVVVFNAAILYFSQTDLEIILSKIIGIENNDLVFCGMFPINTDYADHKIHFSEPEDFLKVIHPFFEQVAIREIDEGGVRTIYFRASKPIVKKYPTN